jgi:quinolinate synthase
VQEQLIARIEEQKASRRAVILVHNYQPAEIQDIGDYVGDSLGLSRTAAETDAEVIVFCGVHFMAETAAILCPGKTVLMPDERAGCPMANMVQPRKLAELKAGHPDATVVTYVNSSAETKALSDVCCTSANAVAVVESLPAETPVIFVPDRNLGQYVERKTGRKLILWNGYCPTHERIRPGFVRAARAANPEAVLVVHPECPPEVVDLADHVASTTGILRYCAESAATTFIIGTEVGLLHRLQKENPGKTFVPATEIADCPNMKLTDLQSVLWCLEELRPVITVDPDVAAKARRPIERMLEVTGG